MTSIRNIAKTEFGSFNGLHWGQGIKIKTDTKPIVQQNGPQGCTVERRSHPWYLADILMSQEYMPISKCCRPNTVYFPY